MIDRPRKVAALCCSGVLQVDGVSDGIGDLADKLHGLPNVTVFRRYRHDSEQAMAIELAHGNVFDAFVFAAHSEGARWVCDTSRNLNDFGRVVEWCIFADGWQKGGVLRVPANVENVQAWIQSKQRKPWKRRPHGSEIFLEATQSIFEPIEAPVKLGHNRLDSLPAFHSAVVAAALAAGG